MEATNRPFLTYRVRDILIVCACIVAHALYLAITQIELGILGFPLDDAWIYQTYARNLAQTGQWAFVRGIPSTGSTSVLWTLLLAPIHIVGLDPRWWTQLLGLLLLIATALGAARMYDEDPPRTSLIIGLAVALEWHLVWAAASGMETMLFTAMMLWFWIWLRRRDPALVGYRWYRGFLLGIFGGALMLARPEGVLAFMVAAVYGLIIPERWSAKFMWFATAIVGFGLLIAPFFGLNYLISGQIWPNTFYAKQTEYAALWQASYFSRLWEQISTTFIGAQILLIPGVIYELYRDIRYHTDWVSLVPWVWAIGHFALYAARLPVTYQHGRYAIPVIPLLLIWGVRGLLRIARPRHRNTALRLSSMLWLASVSVLFPVVLIVLGAKAYSRDVAFIETEMVSTARWVEQHIDADTPIAAHDIGALGYFAPHPLVDLAGLVSPDVISEMNDETRLRKFILASDADYLIIFPRWSLAYASMLQSDNFCLEWSAEEAPGYSALSPQGPMTIYRIDREGGCD